MAYWHYLRYGPDPKTEVYLASPPIHVKGCGPEDRKIIWEDHYRKERNRRVGLPEDYIDEATEKKYAELNARFGFVDPRRNR